jgi:hypothetical protein
MTHNNAGALALRRIELQHRQAVNLTHRCLRATTNFQLVQRTNHALSYFHPNVCVD